MSGGTDGQYFNLGVPDELRRNLNLKKIFFYWDPAHRIMLAEKDIRTAKVGNTKNDQFPFLTKLFDTIKLFLNDANYGKKYEHLIEVSEKYEGEKFYKLHSISTTRFAAYIHLVLLAFLNDIKFIVESLNERSNNDDEDAKILLRRICNIDFLTLLVGMIDVYNVVAKVCGYVQKVNLFIWERHRMIKKSISTMKAMVQDLHTEAQTISLWPKLHTYWPLIEHNQLIKNVPVAQTDQGRYSLRSWLNSSDQTDTNTPFTKTRRQIQEVLETFQTTLSSRLLTQEDEDLCTHTSRLIDIRQYEILASSLGPEPF